MFQQRKPKGLSKKHEAVVKQTSIGFTLGIVRADSPSRIAVFRVSAFRGRPLAPPTPRSAYAKPPRKFDVQSRANYQIGRRWAVGIYTAADDVVATETALQSLPYAAYKSMRLPPCCPPGLAPYGLPFGCPKEPPNPPAGPVWAGTWGAPVNC